MRIVELCKRLQIVLMSAVDALLTLNVSALSPDEAATWKKRYERESFPGLEVS